jgi:hypothetical protein
MHLRLFRHKTQRREFDDRHQPGERRLEGGNSENQRCAVAPTGAAAARSRETESEWPWWLSSQTTKAAASGRGSDDEADVGRRWSLQQDETTSWPVSG